MDEVWITTGGIIIGIATTVVVSHYYFRRSIGKSLTPYIQFSSSPLKDIDPDVRKDLDVLYQEHVIEDLYEIQFLIANTGDRPIRDVIEPLTLHIPGGCTLLDASLLHIEPKDRKVGLQIDGARQNIVFDIPLLNRDEFFVVKLLLNGTPERDDFSFSIVAEDLPPTLEHVPLPLDSIATEERKKFQTGLLVSGIVITVLGLSVFKLIYDRWLSLPEISQVGWAAFLSGIEWGGWAAFASILPGFSFVVVGVLMAVSSFTEGSFPPRRRKFVVPQDKQLLRKGSMRLSEPGAQNLVEEDS